MHPVQPKQTLLSFEEEQQKRRLSALIGQLDEIEKELSEVCSALKIFVLLFCLLKKIRQYEDESVKWLRLSSLYISIFGLAPLHFIPVTPRIDRPTFSRADSSLPSETRIEQLSNTLEVAKTALGEATALLAARQNDNFHLGTIVRGATTSGELRRR